ncbi:hypothetical protein DMC63_14395 [Streptomyces sp. WAC 05977]|nr:hypothetical protein DMC63_14395 [Streptomyces sp. WAC 05977]
MSWAFKGSGLAEVLRAMMPNRYVRRSESKAFRPLDAVVAHASTASRGRNAEEVSRRRPHAVARWRQPRRATRTAPTYRRR